MKQCDPHVLFSAIDRLIEMGMLCPRFLFLEYYEIKSPQMSASACKIQMSASCQVSDIFFKSQSLVKNRINVIH